MRQGALSITRCRGNHELDRTDLGIAGCFLELVEGRDLLWHWSGGQTTDTAKKYGNTKSIHLSNGERYGRGRSAGWRDGCPAAGMSAKAVRSGHWLGSVSVIIG